MSEFDLEKINTKELRSNYKTEYNDGVYRFTHKEWGEHPHFSTVFFDERKKVMLLQAMTDRGYHALVNTINEYDELFEVKSSEKSQREIDKINDFMALVLPDINAGRKPDIEKLAKKTGVDIKTAHDLVRKVLGKLDDMDKYLK